MPVIRTTLRSTLCATGALSLLALGTGVVIGGVATSTSATAQGFFLFDPPPQRPKKAVKRVRRSRPVDPEEARSARPGDKSAATEKPANGPLLLNVSIRQQRVRIYDADGFVTESPISSGMVGFPTPTGIFSVLEKNRVHHSNLYHGAPMPNMQRITWSGVALHAGALPGYPASHGCIRLPYGFSRKLFGMTKMGTRVIVSRDPVEPQSFSHDRLFKAFPPEGEVQTGAATAPTKVADATGAGMIVTAAVASEAPPPSRYRLNREAEAAKISAAIRDAGYARTAATTRLQPTAATANAARETFITARSEWERLEGAARKAEAQKSAAAAEFAAFAKRLTSVRSMTEEELAKAAAKEDALEARAFELADAAEEAQKTAAESKSAAEKLREVAVEAEQKRKLALNDVADANNALARALAAEDLAKRRDAVRAKPISVLISRKTQRLYIRQGYEPILDVPVTIEKPEAAIGTHVFTALDYTPSKTGMTWSVTSIDGVVPNATRTETRKTKRGREARVEIATATDQSLPMTPEKALERVSMPDEVREQIEDVMKPASSLIITDYGIGNETGKFTDFIIQTR